MKFTKKRHNFSAKKTDKISFCKKIFGRIDSRFKVQDIKCLLLYLQEEKWTKFLPPHKIRSFSGHEQNQSLERVAGKSRHTLVPATSFFCIPIPECLKISKLKNYYGVIYKWSHGLFIAHINSRNPWQRCNRWTEFQFFSGVTLLTI